MKENFLYDYKKELTDAIWQVDEEVFREAVRILYQAWREDRQVFIMGNGGKAPGRQTTLCAILGKMPFRAMGEGGFG
mgnify:CR=1 FL=1